MSPELELALDAADVAGRITLRYFQARTLKVMTKRDRSPVTLADREAEKKIRSILKAAFPKDGILGEEFGEVKGKSGRRWILDPIDGTKSFIHGVPLYGVMLALEDDGVMRLGVVHFPALSEICYAEKGNGSFHNFHRSGVSEIADISNATLCTTSDTAELNNPYSGAYHALKSKAGLVRMWGDCYGHCLVATGRADIMIDPKMNPWDIAALIPIVEEAGGKCFDKNGVASIHSDGFISANAALAPLVLKQVSTASPRTPAKHK